jgi:hypothetical protein
MGVVNHPQAVNIPFWPSKNVEKLQVASCMLHVAELHALLYSCIL